MIRNIGSNILRFLSSGLSFLRSLLFLFLIVLGGRSRSLSFLRFGLGFLCHSRFSLILSIFLAPAALLVDRFKVILSSILVIGSVCLEECQLAEGSSRGTSRAAGELGNASIPGIARPPLLDPVRSQPRVSPEMLLSYSKRK